MKISDMLKLNRGSGHASSNRTSEQKPLVLVIDDEEMVHIALEQHLTAMGYATAYAYNSEQTYDILQDQIPALILLDIFIPGNNTMELMTALKRRPELKQTSIVVISGTKNVNAIASYLRAGASDYQLKPFHGELLKARLRNNLSHARVPQDNQASEALQQENDSLKQQLEQLQARLSQAQQPSREPGEQAASKALQQENKTLQQQLSQLQAQLEQLKQNNAHTENAPAALNTLLTEAHKKLQHTIETNRMMSEKLEHDLNNVVLGVSTASRMISN